MDKSYCGNVWLGRPVEKWRVDEEESKKRTEFAF